MPHVERHAENETFVGNTDVTGGLQIPAKFSHLQTARLGDVALDIEGKKIPTDQMRPLFIGKADIDAYNRIREAEFSAITNGYKR